MAIKSLLPAIAGFIMNGVNTLLDIGVRGVCWADTFNPDRMNKATIINVLLLVIQAYQYLSYINGEINSKFHEITGFISFH